MFCKKGVLRIFTKFTGKHLCQRLFSNKIAGLRTATLLKKSFWHKCFPVNFVKFLRKIFLQNTSGGCFCTLLLRWDNLYSLYCLNHIEFDFKNINQEFLLSLKSLKTTFYSIFDNRVFTLNLKRKLQGK